MFKNIYSSRTSLKQIVWVKTGNNAMLNLTIKLLRNGHELANSGHRVVGFLVHFPTIIQLTMTETAIISGHFMVTFLPRRLLTLSNRASDHTRAISTYAPLASRRSPKNSTRDGSAEPQVQLPPRDPESRIYTLDPAR